MVKSESQTRCFQCVKQQNETYFPRPDVDDHVMLVSHTDNVFAVGRESHAGDAIFVRLELRHLSSFCHIPQSDRRKVTALLERKEGCAGVQTEFKGNS